MNQNQNPKQKHAKKVRTWLRLFLLLFIMGTGISGISLPSAPSRAVLTAQAASSVPGLSAKITKNNVLKLLKKYDTSGYYILKKQVSYGDNILSWFSGSSTILAGIDTAVHEETHSYSFTQKKGYDVAYYVGNKKTIYVNYTKVYSSYKMASSIPSRLRTDRYSLYVAGSDNTLSSNTRGIYGLLNEFMAYGTGMNTTVSLYDYLMDQDSDWTSWRVFINQCENDMLAYSEFKYFMLHYLYYAKKNYPTVYKGIVNNKQFCKAYKKLESSFKKQIKQYLKLLNTLPAYFAEKGYTLTITDESVMLSTGSSSIGLGRFYEDYLALQAELSKSRYTKLHKKLLQGAK
ncbi:MAG: hypothetical protein LUI13_03280 [Lachnospiraceae bacterium]|nr:hypothetical protein [Lachnospiraceae bacterium]